MYVVNNKLSIRFEVVSNSFHSLSVGPVEPRAHIFGGNFVRISAYSDFYNSFTFVSSIRYSVKAA